MKTPLEKQKELDEANLRSARIMLASKVLHENSLEKAWARMIVARAEEKGSDVG